MSLSTLTRISKRRMGVLLVAALVPMLAIVLFLGESNSKGARALRTGGTQAARAGKTAAPTASDFAGYLAGVANQAATERGDAVRIHDTHCVQAAPGQYMCSYAVQASDAADSCHLVQARWTPQLASTITVTLSGKSKQCGSLREAIRTLG